MKFEIGAMTIGDILDRGLKLLLTRLPTFYAINLIVLSPLLILRLAVPATAEFRTSDDAPVFFGGALLQLVLILILQPISTAAILHIIAQAFVGERATVGEGFRFAFHSFGRLLWASFLAGLTIGVGYILCCVPGILFSLWYVFIGQVVVVEHLRATSALGRSKELSEGYRWRVLGLLVLLGVAGIMLASAVNVLGHVLPTYEAVPADVGVKSVLNYRNHAIHVLAETLLNILVQTYGAICWTLFYFDLRIRKEGFDLELAAQQQASVVS